MIATKRLSTPLLLGLMLVSAACGGTGGSLGSVPPVSPTPTASVDPGPDLTPEPSTQPTDAPSSEPSSGPSATPSPPPTTAPADTMIVRTYFILAGEPGVEGLVPTLAEAAKAPAVAGAAMAALLDGVPGGERYVSISSAIPPTTELLGLTIRNGVATVDLSTEFDSGGGSASMQYRLAQVVYTLTQFSTVKSVVFQIEGQTVTVFGSEGIVLDGPVDRSDFTDQLPSMFVDRPAFGAAFASSSHVTGTANVFEATFRVAILDGAGKVLADEMVMATCGTGCWGTFDVTVSYAVSKAQWGTLRVYDPSEMDGSPTDTRDYPVWLAPKG